MTKREFIRELQQFLECIKDFPIVHSNLHNFLEDVRGMRNGDHMGRSWQIPLRFLQGERFDED